MRRHRTGWRGEAGLVNERGDRQRPVGILLRQRGQGHGAMSFSRQSRDQHVRTNYANKTGPFLELRSSHIAELSFSSPQFCVVRTALYYPLARRRSLSATGPLGRFSGRPGCRRLAGAASALQRTVMTFARSLPSTHRVHDEPTLEHSALDTTTSLLPVSTIRQRATPLSSLFSFYQ